MTALVYSADRLHGGIERLRAEAEMLEQMATVLRDGSQEYGRVVAALRRVRRARTLADAKRIAQAALSEI